MFKSQFAVSLFFFLHGLCFASWGARIPHIQEMHGLSEATLGSLLLCLPVGSIASMPLAAFLVSRFGSKSILRMAVLLYSLALVVVGYAPQIPGLIFALIIFGLTSNMVNVSLNTQAVKVESLSIKPIMSSLHGLWSVAGFVGAGLGALMIYFKFAPFEHFILILLITWTLALSFQHHLIVDDEKVKSTGKGFTKPSREVLVLGFIAFCSMMCEGAMFDWAGIYFRNVLELEGAWVSAGYVAFMSTMAGTRFVADHFKQKWGLHRVLTISGFLVFSGLMLSVLFPILILCIIGFLLVGAGVSAVVPLVFSESGKINPKNPSGAIAVISSIGFLGFLLGPPLIGWIASLSSLRVSFFIVALIGLGMGFSHRLLTKKTLQVFE